MIRAALFALLVTCPALAACEKFDRQVIDPYVQVTAERGVGAGVVIEKDGKLFILTAAHVAKCAAKPDGGYGQLMLSKESEDGGYIESWRAEVFKVSEKADLALLRPLNPKGLKPAKLVAGVKTERGEDCWYVGTAHGIHGGLEKSIVNRPEWFGYEHTYLVVNGSGWFGNSGGPVFVRRGDDYCLVGIVVIAVANDPKTPLGCEPLSDIMALVSGVESRGSFFDWLRSSASP